MPVNECIRGEAPFEGPVGGDDRCGVGSRRAKGEDRLKCRRPVRKILIGSESEPTLSTNRPCDLRVLQTVGGSNCPQDVELPDAGLVLKRRGPTQAMGSALQGRKDLVLGELRIALKEHGHGAGHERRGKGGAGRYTVEGIDLLTLGIQRTAIARRAMGIGENARLPWRNCLLGQCTDNGRAGGHDLGLLQSGDRGSRTREPTWLSVRRTSHPPVRIRSATHGVE